MKALLIVFILITLPMGCSTTTGNPKWDRAGRITNAILAETFNVVLQAGLTAGVSALEGRNGQDAAAAVFESAARVNGAAALDRILRAAAGPEIAPVSDAAQAMLTKARPVTAEEKKLVVNTIGAAIQTAANQLF